MCFKCILNIGGTPQVQVYLKLICRQVYGEVKYLCDDERRKRAEDEGVSENEVDQADCPQGYADLEAKVLL